MRNDAFNLLSVPDEIIIEILSFCGPNDVVRLEQTCRQLRRICLTREVWYHQLQKLELDYAPRIHPFQDLSSFGPEELRSLVSDAIRSRRSWKTPREMRLVKESEFMVDEDWPPARVVEPRVTPGGKEVLFSCCGHLELWSLERKRRLWRAKSPGVGFSCASVDVDAVEGGKILMIACEYESNSDNPMVSLVWIYRLNVETLESEVLSEWRFPPAYLHNLTIRGDYFMAFFASSFERMVVNWRQGGGIRLDFIDDDASFNLVVRHATLISTHLLAVVNKGDETFVFAMPLSLLDAKWTFSRLYRDWATFTYKARNGPIVPLSYPSVPTRDRAQSDEGIWILSTHVFKPVWRKEDMMEMFIVGYSLAGTRLKKLISYRVRLRTTERDGIELSLVDSSCSLVPTLPWDGHCTFNSGRTICIRRPLRCFELFSNERQPICEVQIEDHPWIEDGINPVVTAVDPWSETIVCASIGRLATYRIV